MTFPSHSFFRVIILFLVAGLVTFTTFFYQYQHSVAIYEEKVFEQVSQRSSALAIKQREIVRAKMFELDRVLLILRDAIQNELYP